MRSRNNHHSKPHKHSKPRKSLKRWPHTHFSAIQWADSSALLKSTTNISYTSSFAVSSMFTARVSFTAILNQATFSWMRTATCKFATLAWPAPRYFLLVGIVTTQWCKVLVLSWLITSRHDGTALPKSWQVGLSTQQPSMSGQQAVSLQKCSWESLCSQVRTRPNRLSWFWRLLVARLRNS